MYRCSTKWPIWYTRVRKPFGFKLNVYRFEGSRLPLRKLKVSPLRRLRYRRLYGLPMQLRVWKSSRSELDYPWGTFYHYRCSYRWNFFHIYRAIEKRKRDRSGEGATKNHVRSMHSGGRVLWKHIPHPKRSPGRKTIITVAVRTVGDNCRVRPRVRRHILPNKPLPMHNTTIHRSTTLSKHNI